MTKSKQERPAKKLALHLSTGFDFQSPLSRVRLERQMESGEDCMRRIRKLSSRPSAALMPKE